MLAGAGASALTVPVLAPARAERAISDAAATLLNPKPLIATPQFEEAFARITGSGFPIEGRMTVTLPEDAENGNIVPYKISIESPMTEADHIARAYLLSTQNPQATVAVFHFTPLSGQATVAGRMRLAKTQEVVAVALTSENKLLIARQLVNVGIGGCGAE
jgi:sulfur-oxidizing protein SoxY